MKKLLLLCFAALALGCVPMPEHSNPYDPETLNYAPQALVMKPDSAIVSVSPFSIELQWPMASQWDEDDFEAYVVLRSPAGLNQYGEIARITSYVKTSYLDVGLTPNTDYEYLVSVEDKGGIQSTPMYVKIRTSPQFKMFGRLQLYITSSGQAAIGPYWHPAGADTFNTLYYLGKNESGHTLVGYQKVYRNETAQLNPGQSFFVDGTPIDDVVDRRQYLDYSPLENSLFRMIMRDFNPAVYDTMKDPLGTALKNNQIIQKSLSFTTIAEKYDTVFIGVTYFAGVMLPGNIMKQSGVTGVLVFKPIPNGYSFDRFFELSAVKHETVRDDHFLRVAMPAITKPGLFLAGYFSGWEGIVERNPSTGQSTLLLPLKVDGFISLLFRHTITWAGTEMWYAGIGDAIIDPIDPTHPKKAPIKLFNDISNFAVDWSQNLYICDRSMSGLTVVDPTGVPVSKWTKLGQGDLSLSSSDFIVAAGPTVIFSIDGRSLWRTIP